jgi:hypothetical protein
MARRAAKVDANQAEIVEGLRACGYSVQPLHMVGSGCPDLLVGIPGSKANALLEVKVPGETFTGPQKTWHADWKGRAHVVRSLAEAIVVLKAYG